MSHPRALTEQEAIDAEIWYRDYERVGTFKAKAKELGTTKDTLHNAISRIRKEEGMNAMYRFYVYKLSDPRDGKPFYVGKGTGQRCHDHRIQAKRGAVGAKCDRIRAILASGKEPKIEKVKRFATEIEAYDYERELIEEIGIENLTNQVSGSIRIGSEENPYEFSDPPLWFRPGFNASFRQYEFTKPEKLRNFIFYWAKRTNVIWPAPFPLYFQECRITVPGVGIVGIGQRDQRLATELWAVLGGEKRHLIGYVNRPVLEIGTLLIAEVIAA